MKTCPECEYPNDDGEHRCEKCGIRFELEAVAAVTTGAAPYSRAATAENPLDFPVAARASLPPPPAWRGEVRHRVRGFRERKGSQGSLPFESPATTLSNVIRFPAREGMDTSILPPALTAKPQTATAVAAPDEASVAARVAAPVAAPVATPVATWGPPPASLTPRTSGQPAAEQQAIAFPRVAAEPQSMLDFPVAPLKLRAMAGAFDATIVLAGLVLFCAACYFAGVRLPMPVAGAWPPRVWLLPAAAVAAVLPILYLSLFLICTAATPGMRWTRLRLVDFDGRPATRRQRRRRVLASVSSLASLLLGFLWATVDEEHLTWHDRMSETCLTSSIG